jgi:rhamnose utilization protein RhaD (predicted bifunctional aldolase and dehydrogenase)/NAD(P)-dependent dehydrogenase (short-subunit alcohol dehydrogenase family)
MKSNWSDKRADEFRSRYGTVWGDALALRTYSSRLIGNEKRLVLRGGGNTSVKDTARTILGASIPAIFIKASGHDLVAIEPDGHAALALDNLLPLRSLEQCSDADMVNELRRHLLAAGAPAPSIEALLHAFLPPRYIDHTHADAILTLSNQTDGARVVRDALGESVIVLDYVKPGFELAQAAADAFERRPDAGGMVLMKHGLVTWGDSARESYEKTITLVTAAESYIAKRAARPVFSAAGGTTAAEKHYLDTAPILRGLSAVATGNRDWPHDRFILRPLITEEILSLLDSDRAQSILLSSPVTADHLIRTKPLPMLIGRPAFDDRAALRKQLSDALEEYAKRYEAYVQTHADRLAPGIEPFDSRPRVIFIPGLGAVCLGSNAAEADTVRDISVHAIEIKRTIAAMGEYDGLSAEQLFDMEYYTLQHAKLYRKFDLLLGSTVAVITGAAGAIGAGISEALLEAGCHVAVTDLAGEALDSLVAELSTTYAGRVVGIPVDVTDRESVAKGFEEVIREWGGIDLIIPNAGLAHVSSIAEMEEERFRELERVNIEGTLNIFSEAARHFQMQATGGDIVLVSTKNVFAPGAKFSAYSATKAAAHQIARVASIELAGLDVRVNMVSPDAVFSHGNRASGLWSEIGPERMRARGLDDNGLEEYYRNRNLLKMQVTARHVARAVLFFATRQTPTTGATIPVDGGLPDSTPR